MRDPARIEKVLAAIREVWEKRPDLRLGQIIATAARKVEPCPDVFYVEDEDLVKKIQDLFPTVPPAPPTKKRKKSRSGGTKAGYAFRPKELWGPRPNSYFENGHFTDTAGRSLSVARVVRWASGRTKPVPVPIAIFVDSLLAGRTTADEAVGSKEWEERTAQADLSFPVLAVVGPAGTMHLGDGNHRVWKVHKSGGVTVMALVVLESDIPPECYDDKAQAARTPQLGEPRSGDTDRTEVAEQAGEGAAGHGPHEDHQPGGTGDGPVPDGDEAAA